MIGEWDTMVRSVECVSNYRNGNYQVILFPNGTKVRYNDEDNLTPDFAESIDVTITKYCDNNCPYCYMGCSESGKHGKILNKKFLDSIPCGTEIAINGNDLSHPDLTEFLIYLKNRGVIVNITVSQEHFLKKFSLLKGWQDAGLIHGIGVSYHYFDYALIQKSRKVRNLVFHIVIGVVDFNDVRKLKSMRGRIKVLFLGYKTSGRGDSYLGSDITGFYKNFLEYFNHISDLHTWFSTVCYDNLAIRQLNIREYVNKSDWDRLFLGEDGQYSYYIDLVDGEYGISSFDSERYSLKDIDYDVVRGFHRIQEIST